MFCLTSVWKLFEASLSKSFNANMSFLLFTPADSIGTGAKLLVTNEIARDNKRFTEYEGSTTTVHIYIHTYVYKVLYQVGLCRDGSLTIDFNYEIL